MIKGFTGCCCALLILLYTPDTGPVYLEWSKAARLTWHQAASVGPHVVTQLRPGILMPVANQPMVCSRGQRVKQGVSSCPSASANRLALPRWVGRCWCKLTRMPFVRNRSPGQLHQQATHQTLLRPSSTHSEAVQASCAGSARLAVCPSAA